jgi:hypothetical protein
VAEAAAALVKDAAGGRPVVLTEHDVFAAAGRGVDLRAARVADHVCRQTVVADPSWSLEKAACSMVGLGALHLVVCDQGEVVGVLRMRDIVRCWTDEGATCELLAELVPDAPSEARDDIRAELERKWADVEGVVGF